ncbi:gliding motility-associated C-terminal domain-containing protein [Flavobacterium sp.]|uniref:gliding motility-associated C-terminal domain-containing protein n=1 Tax=Flavobacterium sp. TaxID=239 RepID=UPI002B963848|nr:gliding motility-associated C-terminal domain-containing protein [Flavobacterium sp.]HSD05718.1 gliding motility-associated C-terminal domain-containing protein [Flavobacterium sp.]
MVQKLHFPTYFVLAILFFCSIDSNAQCAGNDNTVPDVCNISATSSQSINLASFLGPHTAGGTWNDDNSSGGLDTASGILNAQKIRQSGTYHYTYSLNNINGCTDSATITITIGGYTGIPQAANACSDDTQFSLFQAFNGAFVLPQKGGLWHDDTPSGGVDIYNGILNATIPPTGINYSYTYTVDAIGTCPQVSSTIRVLIVPYPKSGSPTDLNVCSNNLIGYTNFNLNNLLSNEDPGGKWTELSGTSEITSPLDNAVNVQNIYNTKGAGSYSFRYTVIPEYEICLPEATTIVTIKIEELLDLTGATLAISPNTICEDVMPITTYTATFTKGSQNIPDGSYEITYTINGAGLPKQAIVNCTNGKLTGFTIPPSNFQTAGNYTISIVNFRIASSSGACSNIMSTTANAVLSIDPIPKINNATLSVEDPICQSNDAMVSFSGISNLTDGDYDILYNIRGSNRATSVPAVLSIAGGQGNFSIPKTLIPNVGPTTIAITRITNSNSGCTNASTLSASFTINPLLDVSNLKVDIKQVCQGQPATVKLTGLGTLSSIEITYNISGLNNRPSQTIPLAVVSGAVSFDILATDIPNLGLTIFTITNVTNLLTGCSIATNKIANFTVNPIPNIPVAIDQSFCTADNAAVANLLPQGNQYQWFDSAISTVPLVSTTPLQSASYYVKEVNHNTGCGSGLKMVNVTINPTPQINSASLAITSGCQSNTVTVSLDNSNLTDGNYNILYNLSGANTGIAIVAVVAVNNGVGLFSIPGNLILNAGSTTVTITNITNPVTNCSNTVNLSTAFITKPLPDISNLAITINNVCQGQDATVQLSGLGTLTTININFGLTGANAVPSKTISLIANSGKASFTIPASDMPNSGLTTFTMIDITNTVNGCPLPMNKNVDFTINSPPNATAMTLSINDSCPKQPLNVTVSGLGTLTNISLSYAVSGANTVTSQTVSLVVIGGSTSFVIPGSELAITGSNTIFITNLTNSITSCSTVVNSVSKNFSILPIPNNPIANNQEFCVENLATVANLIPNGSQYKWYDSANSTTALPANTILVTGNYYLRETNLTTGCESNATTVSIVINSVPTPSLKSNGQDFCGADKPTIQNLSSNTNYTGNLTWYNSPTNGTALVNTDFLTEGTSYYGIDYNPITKCISPPLEATVTLTTCNVTPDGLFIPDAFSPNGDGVNDTFKINDIEFLFPNFSLEIFNRYGNILFKGNINKPDWDGKNSNSNFINGDAPSGVYFYIINYNKDNFKPRQGQLYLNR